jgi:hypothetical protein
MRFAQHNQVPHLQSFVHPQRKAFLQTASSCEQSYQKPFAIARPPCSPPPRNPNPNPNPSSSSPSYIFGGPNILVSSVSRSNAHSSISSVIARSNVSSIVPSSSLVLVWTPSRPRHCLRLQVHFLKAYPTPYSLLIVLKFSFNLHRAIEDDNEQLLIIIFFFVLP